MDLGADDHRHFEGEGTSPFQDNARPEINGGPNLSELLAKLPTVVLIPDCPRFLLAHLSIGGRDFIRPGSFHPKIVSDFDDELLAQGLSSALIVKEMQILGGAILFRTENGTLQISPYSENLGPCEGERVAAILRENLADTSIELVPYKRAG